MGKGGYGEQRGGGRGGFRGGKQLVFLYNVGIKFYIDL